MPSSFRFKNRTNYYSGTKNYDPSPKLVIQRDTNNKLTLKIVSPNYQENCFKGFCSGLKLFERNTNIVPTDTSQPKPPGLS